MSNPYLVKIPFCNTGNKNTIQIERQPTQEPQDATYTEGFPPVTMIPETGGGIAPNGLDFNGIFYELSSPIAHYCRGDRILFDAVYAAAIGGYNKGAILISSDYTKEYISLVDNNTVDPNGSNTTGFWSIYAGQGSVPVATSTTTGTVKLVNSLSSTATDAALTAAQGKVIADSFASLKAGNGYQKLYGGLTLQWGTVDYSSNPGEITVNVTFPIAFGSVALNIQLTRKSLANNFGDGVVSLVSSTRTGFTAQLNTWDTAGTTGLRGFTWFAIGY